MAVQLADPSAGLVLKQDCKAAVNTWALFAADAYAVLRGGKQYTGPLRLAAAACPKTRTSAAWAKGHVAIVAVGRGAESEVGAEDDTCRNARGNA